ncbi:MAG: hypothetical protein AB8H86_07855 [Polyangiales bacterium]
MKRSLALAILALLTFASAGLAQEAGDPQPDERLRVGVHTQLGFLSPVGVLGGFVSVSTPRFSLMVGGGYALSGDDGWRAGLGVSRLFSLTKNNSLGIEAWAAVGSWRGVGDPGSSGRRGEWEVMPTGHLHLSYEARFADRIVVRMFLGAMTNFGAKPSNAEVCDTYCDGPVIGPSTGLSVGVLL